MILEKYRSIIEKPEAHRNKWAFGLTIVFSALIFFGWTVDKGWVSFKISEDTVAKQKPAAQMAAVANVPSPIETSKETFKAGFEEINKKYQELKDSVSGVLVPFITSIEVYDREQK